MPRPDESYVTSGTARLWSTASGRRTPLLMFNGGPGSDDYLGPVAEMIDDLCQVIRFEPRGCGRSDWDGNYDVDTLLTDAEAIRRRYGAERCIVAGHSFGPNAALAYAPRAILIASLNTLTTEDSPLTGVYVTPIMAALQPVTTALVAIPRGDSHPIPPMADSITRPICPAGRIRTRVAQL